MAKSQFETFLREEVNKVKGIYYPVRAGFLRRRFIRRADIRKLHPNPDDEFCFPEIGPNYSILSDYAATFARYGTKPADMQFVDTTAKEPIEVERTMPDGYMILNGHHRWGGAIQAGKTKVSIRIIDLTRETDIRKMLLKAKSDRRVTVDLDEVVFRTDQDPWLERKLRFPLNRQFKERIRLGIPALFQALNGHGYDIWVFTSRYLSLDYLRYYFKHYHVHVTGIVTGTMRKGEDEEKKAELKRLFEEKYNTTVIIDNEVVIRTREGSADFDEYRLSGSPETWSREVLDVFEKMWKHE